MAWRWLPWRAIVRRAARAYGVIDPLRVMARLRRFSQPSEIAEPLELLRAGLVFHARGLVNTKAIQHNLDWVWPYWVVRQFDPGDASFIPRAFSFSHVNLTHRNWTAVGLPDCPHYPIVDPRGLWTPLHDGWSIDCWIVAADGNHLLPGQCGEVKQSQDTRSGLAVDTTVTDGPRQLTLHASVERIDGRAWALLDITARGGAGDRLALAVRPYNPEGIQFIDNLHPAQGGRGFRVNDTTDIELDPAPVDLRFRTYRQGDVFHALDGAPAPAAGGLHCPVGMATGAAVYPMPDGECRLRARVALDDAPLPHGRRCTWADAHADTATVAIPDAGIQQLFEAARTSLVLHSVDDIVPGPYTYRRFWFRDACLILHALLAGGYIERARRALESFPQRQRASGYFQSQEGEWDSNGQVLWAYGRFQAMTGESLPASWLDAIERGSRWIRRKRLGADAGAGIAGLLPAGFSAEHLGPNDYYYWDDWWALAGLQEAARVLADAGREHAAGRAREEAESLRRAIHRSIERIPHERSGGGMPAAPDRRMDAGAIGSLVADYPLRLLPAADPWTLATIDYLERDSFFEGGFFQNMIHSGINAYLTLDIAQSLLRAGQPERAWPMIRRVAELASSTGHWPEAIHPRTGGGCMGDGQHVWAAAEWFMIVRSLFVREEGDSLVIGSGLPPEWLASGQTLRFGPTWTAWGRVDIEIDTRGSAPRVCVHGRWHDRAPHTIACLPGWQDTAIPADGSAVEPERRAR